MLALRSVARPLRSAALRPLAMAARGLCAPAVPLSDEVTTDIEDMKAKLDSKVASAGYSPEALEAALNAGKVDISELNAAMANFSEPARKLAAKLAMESAKMNLEMQTPPSLDWAAWEGKISDPAVLAKVKAITEAEVEKGMADFQGPNTDELQKEVEHEFNKAGGLFDQAKAEETAAEAGMANIIAEMEKLQLDVEGIKNVTIAEILEREPELRAEIEEEIKNNVWAP